jgi:hypothetical protein
MLTSPTMLNAALTRQNSDAQGKEVGDFFQYDLGERITLSKNQSALVPILNAPIKADKVTVWNEDSGALRVLWLKSAEEKALTQRYTGQLNAQEDRFASLRKEIADIKTQRDQAQQELERMVWAINLDEGF